MNKKKLTALICAFMCAALLCACGKNDNDKSSQISGDGTNVSDSADSSKNAQSSEKSENTENSQSSQNSGAAQGSGTVSTPAPNITPMPTLPPIATQDPEAIKKTDEKAAKSENNANVTINDGNGSTKQVSLKFTVTNKTGINFVKFMIVPANIDYKAGQNVLPENLIFANGQSLELDPGASTTLETPMFNFVGVTEEGRGYVFPNIDLAANSLVELMLDNGVPKAVMQ